MPAPSPIKVAMTLSGILAGLALWTLVSMVASTGGCEQPFAFAVELHVRGDNVDLPTAELAATLIERVPLPPQAAADAAHMAVAAYHGVDFLLTWNVAHSANAAIRRRVEGICREQGYDAPIVCTPDELMEDSDE